MAQSALLPAATGQAPVTAPPAQPRHGKGLWHAAPALSPTEAGTAPHGVEPGGQESHTLPADEGSGAQNLEPSWSAVALGTACSPTPIMMC